MANQEQLKILKQGAEVWNEWRENLENSNTKIDLRGANLVGAYLSGANLKRALLSNAHLKNANLSQVDLAEAHVNGADIRGADLTEINLSRANCRKTNLRRANLYQANLTGTDLRSADLTRANLSKAVLYGADFSETNLNEAELSEADMRKIDLSRANLSKANLRETDLSEARLFRSNLFRANLSRANLYFAHLKQADFSEANLSEANLSGANLDNADFSNADLSNATMIDANLGGTILVGANINKAKISGSSIYAVNVWDLKGEFDEQKDLIITPRGASIITVDNIKVAQFIYLILNNTELRDVINTLTSKTVLILGRFADDERKMILNALRDRLREYNLIPIVFDFDRPIDRNITETVKTLAGISYFVIADVTSPKSSPLELQAIVPDYQIPVIPIIYKTELPFSMINDLRSQHSGLLDPLTYSSKEMLIKALKPAIIDRAIEKHNELRLIKAQKPKISSVEDFLDKGKDE